MPISSAPISHHGNAWNNAAVPAGGLSAIIDTYPGSPFVSVFGNVGGATTVQVLYSQDGVNFYSTGAAHQFVAAGITDFALDFQPSCRYLQLKSTAAVTITATVCGKSGPG